MCIHSSGSKLSFINASASSGSNALSHAVCLQIISCLYSVLQISGHLSRGTLVQNFTSVLAIIMRLRQVGSI
jgi:hypothetical protein